MGKAFYTGAQSPNKSESLMYAFTLKSSTSPGMDIKHLLVLTL